VGNQIARVDPSSHQIAEYPLPADDSQPFGIATGPDGAVWFIEGGGEIGRIETSSKAITEFVTPSPAFATSPGPDASVWFFEGGRIARIDTVLHQITESSNLVSIDTYAAMTPGQDQDLWFPDYFGNNIVWFRPNSPPVANDDFYETPKGGEWDGNVLANDTDADGDPLTATLVSGPRDGTLVLNTDGSFTYRPNVDFLSGTSQDMQRSLDARRPER
jgi:streptogramin lyase